VKEEKKVTTGSWLVLDMKGPITEHTLYSDSFFGLDAIGLSDIMEKLAQARTDSRIEGLILKPKSAMLGMAEVNQFHNLIKEFKMTGKPVLAYIDNAGSADYYLCTAADEIWLNPSQSAGIMLNGVGATVVFYKDLLTKIGVKVNVIHAGKYKSAGDSYSRNTMSPEMKESYTLLLKERFLKLKQFLTLSRKMTPEQVEDVFQKRENFMIKGDYAYKSGIVDTLGYEGDMLTKYGIDEDKLVRISKYGKPQFPFPGNKIAVVYAEGVITSVSSGTSPSITAKTINKVFDSLENDDEIKAVVLRINSPGGSSLESDIIANRIQMLKQRKPVVVSMGDVAASGGYYISAPCDYIFADPFTITGSIGVIMMMPDASGLADDIGIKTESISLSKFHGLGNLWEKPSQELLSAFGKEVDDIYTEFKTVVSDGRKMPMDKVEKYAQGRVWGADMADSFGLVDQIGSLGDAVLKASELSNTSDYTIALYPKKKSFFDFILDNKGNFIGMMTQQEKGVRTELLQKATDLEKMLQEQKTYMMLPFEIEMD
ncbi:MAG: signal peptide peptidase SppA, partial [Candidatus Cloacimonetes bacterium]|nr:signal peptide peptidase SppA [Candidatus Cloacimonadota bacterium]